MSFFWVGLPLHPTHSPDVRWDDQIFIITRSFSNKTRRSRLQPISATNVHLFEAVPAPSRHHAPAVCETPPRHVADRQLRSFFLLATHLCFSANCACAMLSSLRILPVIATPSRTMIILYQQTHLLRSFAQNYWFACYSFVGVAWDCYPCVGTPVRVFPLRKSSALVLVLSLLILILPMQIY